MKRVPKNNPLIYLLAAAFVFALDARGDIYIKKEKDGTVHFTNIKPRGKDKQNFKVYLKTPPQRRARPGVVPVPARDTNPARYSRYDTSIQEASRTFSVPEAFIRAVIRVESDYNPDVVSWAGAQGLMQLMPRTAESMGVTDAFNPRQNVMGGCRYLRILANRFDGDLPRVIAGYHAGGSAVAKKEGVPYAQSEQYVRWVLDRYYEYKRLLAD